MQTTNPYRYLEQVSELFDTLNTREQINQVIDELEFLFDLIDPEEELPCFDRKPRAFDRTCQAAAFLIVADKIPEKGK